MVSSPFISYNEAESHIGETFLGTISEVKNNIGLIISLSPKISGFIPMHHISDITSSEKTLKDKFKKGKKLRVKILNVDPEKKRITLTSKKSLLESKLTQVKSIEQVKDLIKIKASKKLFAHGTVTRITNTAVTLVFYNNVFGFIPARIDLFLIK